MFAGCRLWKPSPDLQANDGHHWDLVRVMNGVGLIAALPAPAVQHRHGTAAMMYHTIHTHMSLDSVVTNTSLASTARGPSVRTSHASLQLTLL
jgi:hypothetical protein